MAAKKKQAAMKVPMKARARAPKKELAAMKVRAMKARAMKKGKAKKELAAMKVRARAPMKAIKTAPMKAMRAMKAIKREHRIVDEWWDEKIALSPNHERLEVNAMRSANSESPAPVANPVATCASDLGSPSLPRHLLAGPVSAGDRPTSFR